MHSTSEFLISSDDFKQYKNISEHISQSKDIEPYILEAQRLDIMPFLGDAMYYELIRLYPYPVLPISDPLPEPLPTNYTPLIEGEEYTDCEGNLIYFFGLKPAIVYYTFARFLHYLDARVTRFGVVSKTNNFSEKVNEGQKQEIISSAKSNAIYYIRQAEKYLKEKQETYPLWEGCKSKYRKSAFRMYASDGDKKITSSGDDWRFYNDNNKL